MQIDKRVHYLYALCILNFLTAACKNLGTFQNSSESCAYVRTIYLFWPGQAETSEKMGPLAGPSMIEERWEVKRRLNRRKREFFVAVPC
jgi:hypothetical protein